MIQTIFGFWASYKHSTCCRLTACCLLLRTNYYGTMPHAGLSQAFSLSLSGITASIRARKHKSISILETYRIKMDGQKKRNDVVPGKGLPDQHVG